LSSALPAKKCWKHADEEGQKSKGRYFPIGVSLEPSFANQHGCRENGIEVAALNFSCPPHRVFPAFLAGKCRDKKDWNTPLMAKNRVFVVSTPYHKTNEGINTTGKSTPIFDHLTLWI